MTGLTGPKPREKGQPLKIKDSCYLYVVDACGRDRSVLGGARPSCHRFGERIAFAAASMPCFVVCFIAGVLKSTRLAEVRPATYTTPPSPDGAFIEGCKARGWCRGGVKFHPVFTSPSDAWCVRDDKCKVCTWGPIIASMPVHEEGGVMSWRNANSPKLPQQEGVNP